MPIEFNPTTNTLSITIEISENDLSEAWDTWYEGSYSNVISGLRDVISSVAQNKVDNEIQKMKMPYTFEQRMLSSYHECPSCGEFVMELDYCTIKDEECCSSCVEDC